MCRPCEAPVTPTLSLVPAAAQAPAGRPLREPRGCRDCGRGFDAYQRNGDAREIAFANGYVPRLVA
jgi:hypothetical protein